MPGLEQKGSDRYIYQPSRFYGWFCGRTGRTPGELKLTQDEWLGKSGKGGGLVHDYVFHRRHQFMERVWARSLRTKKRRLTTDRTNAVKTGKEKRRYPISKRGKVFNSPTSILEILNRLYSAECAWVILCGEAKAMNVSSSAEVARRLRDRYSFLVQTKRETFVEEACSGTPRELAEQELSEYLGVETCSIPVMLSPSQWPKSEPKWIADLANKHHPAEFDAPIRPRLHRPRRK